MMFRKEEIELKYTAFTSSPETRFIVTGLSWLTVSSVANVAPRAVSTPRPSFRIITRNTYTKRINVRIAI